MQRATSLELRVDAVAHRMLRGAPATGIRAALIEVVVFLLKQAWACVFGAALLAVIVAARFWYPDDAAIARNDALTIAAVVIQLAMLVVFAGVAGFIYLAENIGTWAGAWMYPDQADGWQLVSPSKLVSWFLLMIISVVLVAWVYPPQVPASPLSARRGDRTRGDDSGADAAASAPL